MLGISNEDWQVISTFISAIALLVNVVIATSVLISVRALKESVRAKESTIFTWALDQIREVRPIMNQIRENRANDQWLQQNHESVMKVLDVLQMISFMGIDGVIEKRKIAAMWGKSFIEQWLLLQNFVKNFRQQIGESREVADGAFYARSFESFAGYSKEYLEKEFSIKINENGQVGSGLSK